MEIEKRKHAGYDEFERAVKKGVKIKQYFGKYQYIYSNKKQKISLVELWDMFGDKWFWEIAILKDDGVDGESVERFATQQDAIKKIKELLA